MKIKNNMLAWCLLPTTIPNGSENVRDEASDVWPGEVWQLFERHQS
jgi:hypothetical protein